MALRKSALAIALVVAAGLAGSGEARRSQDPTVELGTAAGLAPDGRSLRIDVIASCPERWVVVEARVTVSQPQASGSGSFPLACIGSKRPFSVIVRSTGSFALGAAQAAARVVVQRGHTAQATDAASIQLDPTAVLDLADTALLQGAGVSASIDVTASCNPGAAGEESYVALQQGNLVARGFYTPTCDGAPHTFSVVATLAQGVFQPGDARALSFATASFAGMSFTGVADEPLQLGR